MAKPVEIDDGEVLGIREPTTLHMKIHKWANGTRVRARVLASDEFSLGVIVNQGYVDGRWVGGYVVRFDSTGLTGIVPYEPGKFIEKV
jgi:hypothetical protein